MRRIRAFLLLAAAIGFPFAASAAASDAPLFAAFKKFCVDTGSKPDAIKAAVEASGGVLSKGPVGSGGWPFVSGLMIWNVTVDGREIAVSAASQHVPQRSSNPPYNSEACTLREDANDPAGVAAIKEWIGVPASRVSDSDAPVSLNGIQLPAVAISYFDYATVGEAHVRLHDAASLHEAEQQGRYWSSVVMSNDHSASIEFTHELGSSDATR